MRKNLLEFLFCPGSKELSSTSIGEDVVRLFESADTEETDQLEFDKKPLEDALKKIGITYPVKDGSSQPEIVIKTSQEYRDTIKKLADPENVYTLALNGWVSTNLGDLGMCGEGPEYRIGFICITTADTGPQDDSIVKGARASEAPKRSKKDPMNPVSPYFPDGWKEGEKQAGIEPTSDGDGPKGKIKGVKEGRKSKTKKIISEITMASAIPAFDGSPMLTAGMPGGGKTEPCKCATYKRFGRCQHRRG